MLKNYFLIAVRTLIKTPLLSVIKVSGLAVGISGCLVIFLMARYELSFDTFQQDRDRVYRVYSQFSGVFEGLNRGVSIPISTVIKNEFTGLEAVVGFQTYSASVKSEAASEEKKFDNQEDIAIVPPDYFEVFSFYDWKAGSPASLNDPFGVAISESKAKKYFGTSDPDKVLGQRLTYNDSLELSVVGIVADVKHHSDFYFNDFISFSTIEKSWLKENYQPDDWGSTNSSSQCFLKLAVGTDQQKVIAQLPALARTYKEKNPEADWKADYHLQPLTDLHFNTELGIFDNGRAEAANMATLKTLMIIASLLLFIAVINFVNLETAQTVRRAKEVGLRKTMGGTRASLVQHFLFESGVLATIAVLLALPLASMAIILFQEFLPEGMVFELADPAMWGFLLLTIVIVSLLAGIYPAMLLSSYQPAVALKNQLLNSRQSRSAQLRKVLTVFQFSASQVLIVGALVVGWQIQFMVNKDLGFRKDAIVNFYTPWWEKNSKAEVLRNELARIPQITAISRHQAPPAIRGYSTNSMNFREGDVSTPINVHQRMGDTSYIRLFDIRLVAGRNVIPSDSAKEMLVNEAFCRKLGFDHSSDLVGKQISRGKDDDYTIVGIMSDFHFRSLHHAIEPLYFAYGSESSAFSVKLSMQDGNIADMESTLDKIRNEYKKVYPDEEVELHFIDETIAQFYEKERKTSKLVNTATGLTIFISCLGLLGLASFTATQRTKEIGIRKVLGATVNSIVALLSIQFLKWVSVAFVLAVPVAWYGSDWWLSGFAYRLPLGWWIFALAGMASLGVAFLTVAFQAMKAAITNPVDSLRYE